MSEYKLFGIHIFSLPQFHFVRQKIIVELYNLVRQNTTVLCICLIGKIFQENIDDINRSIS